MLDAYPTTRIHILFALTLKENENVFFFLLHDLKLSQWIVKARISNSNEQANDGIEARWRKLKYIDASIAHILLWASVYGINELCQLSILVFCWTTCVWPFERNICVNNLKIERNIWCWCVFLSSDTQYV